MKINLDKVRSCIWGGAISDAIGLGTEFMTREQVNNNYKNRPYKYDDIVQDDHRTSWVKSDWSDDTDQSIVLMNTVMSSTDYTTTFAKLLTDWRRNGIKELGDKCGGVGLGKPVAWVMNEECFVKDPKRAAKNVWDLSEYTENGSIMRQNVLGTMNRSLREVIDASVEFCLTTHADPRVVGSCVFTVVVVYHFIRDELDIDLVMDTAKKKSIDEMKKLDYCTQCHIDKFNSFFIDIDDISILNLDKPQVRSTIKQTFRCLLYTLQKLKKGRTFIDIIWDIVLQGGDADTNACVAGGVMGAYFGRVPQELVDGLIYKDYMNGKIDEWIKFNY